METVNEQRMSQRFNVHCLVTFAEEQGWSQDISSTGMYFSTQRDLNEQEVLRLVIHLNRAPAIQCEGKVVRTEKQPDGYGVAVQFTDLLFAA